MPSTGGIERWKSEQKNSPSLYSLTSVLIFSQNKP